MPGFPYSFPFPFPEGGSGGGGEITPGGEIATIPSAAAVAFSKLATYLKTNVNTPKPNIAAVIQVACNRFDELEVAFQALYLNRRLVNAFGQLLDDIGGIVGITRNGLDDDTYRLYLSAQIAADNSSGTTEDLNLIFKYLTPVGDSWVVNWDYGPDGAGFEVLITDTAGLMASGTTPMAIALAMASFIQKAKGGGIRGILEYSLSPAAELFSFMSATDTFDGSGNGPTDQGIGFDQGAFAGALE